MISRVPMARPPGPPEEPSGPIPVRSTLSSEFQAALHSGVREVYRDDVLWVLDKPAGVLSHPNPPSGRATNAIVRGTYDFEREVFLLDDSGLSRREVHLVHRLDQETSGLILCTFRGDAAAILKESLHDREVTKEYRALVLGVPVPPSGEWADHLEKASEGRRLVVRAVPGRINARTRYSVVETIRPSGLALLALWPETGRTHQLRVQAARRSVPIAGDERYGDFTANKFLASRIALKRMFLHALRIELRHPTTGHIIKLQAPLSSRLTTILEKARELAEPVPRRAGGRGNR
jgi:RluA family pseudouridine synthase